jgi:hypothetical protein
MAADYPLLVGITLGLLGAVPLPQPGWAGRLAVS